MNGPSVFRVALFAEQGHPESTFRSGVTRLTDHLVDACRSRDDLRVDFFTYRRRSGTDVSHGIRYHGRVPRVPVRFHGLEVDALDLVPLPNPGFADAAGGHGYDVVLGTSPGIGTQGQLLARLRGLPFAAVYTTDLPHYAQALAATVARSSLSRVSGRLAREAAWRHLAWLYDRRRTDLVLVPTEVARDDLLARVNAEAAVLGRGADTLSFPPRGPRRSGPARLLYVGRVDYGQKNLKALERVVRQIPQCQLWVVGGGDDLSMLRHRLAPEIAEGRVVVPGRIDDPDLLIRRYMDADVFVFPSLFDTLGQVVLEAQGAGLPVVVRDRGGPRELVRHGETGFVATSDDDFVNRVRELVEGPERRGRMARAARLHAASLPGWSQVTDRLLEHLAHLAAGHRRSGRGPAVPWRYG